MSSSRNEADTFAILNAFFTRGTIEQFAAILGTIDDLDALIVYSHHLEQHDIPSDCLHPVLKQDMLIKRIARLHLDASVSSDPEVQLTHWTNALIYAFITRDSALIWSIWVSYPRGQNAFCALTPDRMPACLNRFMMSLEAHLFPISFELLHLNAELLKLYIKGLSHEKQTDILKHVLTYGSDIILETYCQIADSIPVLNECLEYAKNHPHQVAILEKRIHEIKEQMSENTYHALFLHQKLKSIDLTPTPSKKRKTSKKDKEQNQSTTNPFRVNISPLNLDHWVQATRKAFRDGPAGLVTYLFKHKPEEWKKHYFGLDAIIDGVIVRSTPEQCFVNFKTSLAKRQDSSYYAEEFWDESHDILTKYLLSPELKKERLDLLKKVIVYARVSLLNKYLTIVDEMGLLNQCLEFIDLNADTNVRSRARYIIKRIEVLNNLHTVSQNIHTIFHHKQRTSRKKKRAENTQTPLPVIPEEFSYLCTEERFSYSEEDLLQTDLMDSPKEESLNEMDSLEETEEKAFLSALMPEETVNIRLQPVQMQSSYMSGGGNTLWSQRNSDSSSTSNDVVSPSGVRLG